MNSTPFHFVSFLLRPTKPWFAGMFIAFCCSSCSKQIVADAQNNRDLESTVQATKASKAASSLSNIAYDFAPTGSNGPMMGPVYYEFYTASAQQPGYLHIAHDNQSLYLSVHETNWRPANENLKVWIGLKDTPLPLGPNGVPQSAKFPVKHTVVPGTGCFTVEINYYDLATYFNLTPKADRPAACDTEFRLIIQADILSNNKPAKAWSGDSQGGLGKNTYRWVSSYITYCNIMPPPPNDNP